jgi:hypothetical protein
MRNLEGKNGTIRPRVKGLEVVVNLGHLPVTIDRIEPLHAEQRATRLKTVCHKRLLAQTVVVRSSAEGLPR